MLLPSHKSNPEGSDASRKHFSSYPKRPSRDTANTRAILTRSVVSIPDVLKDSDYAGGATAAAAGYRSILSVPLMREASPIGALTVARSEPGAFPQQQLALLQTFADQAVIRDPERSALQRDRSPQPRSGTRARAADGDRRGAARDLELADRRTAGLRRDRRAGDALYRC